MTRSIVSITQSQIQAVDTIKGLEGRRARIYARKLHVEDLDITLHVVVADDDVNLGSSSFTRCSDCDYGAFGVGHEAPHAKYPKAREYHRNIKRQARS